MRYASILNSDLSSLAETVYTYKPKRRKSLDESYSAVSSGLYHALKPLTFH